MAYNLTSPIPNASGCLGSSPGPGTGTVCLNLSALRWICRQAFLVESIVCDAFAKFLCAAVMLQLCGADIRLKLA